jgi:hypothetical protein
MSLICPCIPWLSPPPPPHGLVQRSKIVILPTTAQCRWPLQMDLYREHKLECRPSGNKPIIDLPEQNLQVGYLQVLTHLGVTTMERLDQGHLHPKLEVLKACAFMKKLCIFLKKFVFSQKCCTALMTNQYMYIEIIVQAKCVLYVLNM